MNSTLELPWHEPQWRTTLGQFHAGRLPHALLLTGVRGLGKTQFAERLAALLLCQQPNQQGAPCGTCRGCQLYQADTHPDWRRVAPPEPRRAIVVDQVRDIAHHLSHTAHYGGYKVVMVAPADNMNINAANSLLKTLEEPPAASLLILITSRPSRLPATVLSRCQRIVFAPPTESQASAWLNSQDVGKYDPELLLHLAGGAPLAALELAQGDGLAERAALFETLAGLAERRLDPVHEAAQWLKVELGDTLYWMYSWTTDLIRLHNSEQPPYVANVDVMARMQGWIRNMEIKGLHRYLERIISAMRAREGNANPQLLLEDLFITWQSGVVRRARSGTAQG